MRRRSRKAGKLTVTADDTEKYDGERPRVVVDIRVKVWVK